MPLLRATVRGISEPFLGSEALAHGLLSRHQLRTQYRAVLPNVYLPKQIQPSLGQRIAAAWLWSDRRGTIAGNAAAALHGAKWIDDNVPVELIRVNPRAPQGVLTRRDLLLEGEVQTLAGRAVTTPETHCLRHRAACAAPQRRGPTRCTGSRNRFQGR